MKKFFRKIKEEISYWGMLAIMIILLPILIGTGFFKDDDIDPWDYPY